MGADAGEASVLAATREFGRSRIAREAALDRLIGRTVALHPAGFATIDAASLLAAEEEVAERLLAQVAACIGGARYPARRARITRLRAALRAQPYRSRTLGGCRFVPWRGRILVLREPVAAGPPVRLAAGNPVLWDRRFAVMPPADMAPGLTVGHLGQSGFPAPPGASPGIPHLVHSVLPVLWDATGLLAVPHLGWRRADPAKMPTLSFRPANALTRAGFTVV